MHDHARPLTRQQSVTQLAVEIHQVARPSISTGAIELITYLIGGPRDVGTLAWATSLDIATVSKRLKDLRDAGLVVLHIQGRFHVYQLSDAVSIITVGEHRLVVVPASTGVFAIGIGRAMLEEIHITLGARKLQP